MLNVLKEIPAAEKDIFKQIIDLYDNKKYKKALKLTNRLLEANPSKAGKVNRVLFIEGSHH